MKSLTDVLIDQKTREDIICRHARKFELYPMIKTAIRYLQRTDQESVLIGITMFGIEARHSSIPLTLASFPGFSSKEIERIKYGAGEEVYKVTRKPPMLVATWSESFRHTDRIQFRVNPAWLKLQAFLRRF